MQFIIKRPETADEFEQYYYLRWQILRQPWAQPQGSEKDDIESSCFHFIALSTSPKNTQTSSASTLPEPTQKRNTVIGVSRLQLNTAEDHKHSTYAAHINAQIRYMAVSPLFRNKGIARALMAAMEEQTRDHNISKIILDARKPAVGFYKKLGYRITAKSYLLFDEIQHFKMEKDLHPTIQATYEQGISINF